LKKARVTRGILQREIAEHMGISHFTYIWWERDRYLPSDKQWKSIIEFLGYYPLLEEISELNWVLAVRRQLGLTKKALACRLGIDEQTYSKIEFGKEAHGASISYKQIITILKECPPSLQLHS